MSYKDLSEEKKESHRKSARASAKRKRIEDPIAARTRSRKWAMDNPEHHMFGEARRRAKKKGIDFSIEVSDVLIPEICPLLGIPIFRSVGSVNEHGRSNKMGGAGMNSPSLDRVDSSKGYVKGNVWVISWRANKIKSDATLEELEKMVMALKERLHI